MRTEENNFAEKQGTETKTKERHHTDYGYPKKHTNPRDHDITWTDEGHPQFGPPQNYWDGKIPIF